MSVTRRLVEQQLQITPSMEAARLERGLDELYGQFNAMVESLHQLSSGATLSMESSSALAALGYSTEAEEKKGLITRIWEGIKKIFGNIKEFISRLIAVRKHHLKNNAFKIDKLKNYIHNLDMTATAVGDINISNTLLPNEPGQVLAALGEFRDQAKSVMDQRARSLDQLGNLDVQQLTKQSARDVLAPHLKGSSTVTKGLGSAVFTNDLEKVSYKLVAQGQKASGGKYKPASVVLMGSLLTGFESLQKDDEQFVKGLESHAESSKRIIAMLDKLKDNHDFNAPAREDSLDNWMHDSEQNAKVWHNASQVVAYINKLQRLSHSVVYDALFADLQTVLQASLGAYKFKTHELMPEDRASKKDTSDHEYR